MDRACLCVYVCLCLQVLTTAFSSVLCQVNVVIFIDRLRSAPKKCDTYFVYTRTD